MSQGYKCHKQNLIQKVFPRFQVREGIELLNDVGVARKNIPEDLNVEFISMIKNCTNSEYNRIFSLKSTEL